MTLLNLFLTVSALAFMAVPRRSGWLFQRDEAVLGSGPDQIDLMGPCVGAEDFDDGFDEDADDPSRPIVFDVVHDGLIEFIVNRIAEQQRAVGRAGTADERGQAEWLKAQWEAAEDAVNTWPTIRIPDTWTTDGPDEWSL